MDNRERLIKTIQKKFFSRFDIFYDLNDSVWFEFVDKVSGYSPIYDFTDYITPYLIKGIVDKIDTTTLKGIVKHIANIWAIIDTSRYKNKDSYSGKDQIIFYKENLNEQDDIITEFKKIKSLLEKYKSILGEKDEDLKEEHMIETKSFAESFLESKNSYNRNIWIMYIVLLLTLIAIVGLYLIGTKTFNNLDFISTIISRLLFSAPLIFFAFIITKNLFNFQSMYEAYNHKQRVAEAFLILDLKMDKEKEWLLKKTFHGGSIEQGRLEQINKEKDLLSGTLMSVVQENPTHFLTKDKSMKKYLKELKEIKDLFMAPNIIESNRVDKGK
ncbi:MAG: hypothetical protein JJV93_00220 [Alphaproteobacteria bacterium]|nr:hypothetical protein [Alphaproteobacteria bacterium]